MRFSDKYRILTALIKLVEQMRINVGCGQAPSEYWRNFDNSLSIRLAKIPLLPKLLFNFGLIDQAQYRFMLFARKNAIEYADATKKLPVSDGVVDVLYSSHMLEHLDQQEVALFLKEARRVLRHGGIIRLAVPDISIHIQNYLQSHDADAFIAGTLLTQSRPKSFRQRLKILCVGSRHHQWMYDGASLSRLLEKHGFMTPEILKAGETKIGNPKGIDLFERKWESVYVEAINP